MKIVQTDLDGNEIKVFNSKQDIKKELKITQYILDRCIKENRPHNGFRFKLQNESDGETDKRINRYTIDGKYIDTFEKVSVASKILDICKDSIYQTISGRTKEAGNFQWKYVRDYEIGVNIDKYERMNRAKEVNSYTSDGKYLKTYKSAYSASRDLKISDSIVTASIVNNGLSEGYMFRLASEYEPNIDIEPYSRENIYFKDKIK